MTYGQSRLQTQNEFAIQSLDIVLGLVGGLSSIIWGCLFLVFGGYETFKLENSLIGTVYATQPNLDTDQEPLHPESEAQAKRHMMRMVVAQGKYFYNYSEYMMTKILKCLCNCCCKNKKWYKQRVEKLNRHTDTVELLNNEIDIVKLLQVQRIATFIAKLFLKWHQRALITNFKQYQVKDLSGDTKAEKNTVQMEEETLM